MAEKFQEDVRVLSQNELGDGIYDLVLQTKEIAKAARAGQPFSVLRARIGVLTNISN